MRTARRATAALGALVLGGIASARPAWAAKEVHAYSFDYYSFGTCGGENRSWSAQLSPWYSWMPLAGHNTTGFEVLPAIESLFCDPDSGLPGCTDDQHADAADIVFLGMHGGDQDNHWKGALHFPGTGLHTCGIDAPESPGDGEMFMGDVDAEILHFSSCHSMDDDNIPYVRFLFEDPVDSTATGKRLHLATGFHGVSGVGPDYYGDYGLLALIGQTLPVADAWIDSMYRTDVGEPKCPVSYAVGVDTTNCFNRLSSETYLSSKSDPNSIDAFCAYYIEDCHPSGDDRFTPPQY